jgi:uncharacterized protein HemX
MKSKILFILFFITSFSSFSQEVIEEDYSIKSQFDKIYRTSTTYQIYKVIGKEKYQKLKSNVLDSLKNSKKLISEKENLLKSERENIQRLNTSLNKTKVDLEAALQKENSISLFGAQLNKITYNIILWFIIIVLALCLIFFVFKFSKSNLLTKEAQGNLNGVEAEFDNHKKKSIEREQKLRRQLQDEVNKLRNI